MKGAIIGDIIGSVYEFNNIKTKQFPLFRRDCFFTDDTVATTAVAKGFLKAASRGVDLWTCDSIVSNYICLELKAWGRRKPGRGYGARFYEWLNSDSLEPYFSLGNGAPMRCSPAGWLTDNPDLAWVYGEHSARPTHNHPFALKAAGVTAALICMARNGADRDAIEEFARRFYYIPTVDEIRNNHVHNERSELTMPVALAALIEAKDFEDTIRNAISVGGDSDTIAAIAGSIAEPLFGIPEGWWELACTFLDEDIVWVVDDFYHISKNVRAKEKVLR